MRWGFILYIAGTLLLCLALSMLVPLAFGVYYGDTSIAPLLKSIGWTMGAGAMLFLFFRSKRQANLRQREAMAVVTLGWSAAGLFGCLPFYLSGGWVFIDALFESVSGFTTTGASILAEIEILAPGLLMWRSFIQWIGGMGIIVLSLAILPFLGVGGMQLYKAEVPTPVPDKLTPHIRNTAKVLWKVYALFTLIQVILLLIGGLSLFDALSHAFTTLSTGGFSTRNTSIAHFNSLYTEVVIILFMIMAGINFSLHYQMLRGKTLAFWKNGECRFFLGALVVFIILVTVNLHCTAIYDSIAQALRYGAFQVVSIMTTTGFATADYQQWPAFSQMILLLCMFLGGSAGSTSGGMKVLRIQLCLKVCYKELFSLVHPRAVTIIKLDGKTIPDDVIRSVLGFLALYVGLSFFSIIVLGSMGVDPLTSLGAVAATIGNIGPGFGSVGAVENYLHLPVAAKWLLLWLMLLGRLEIFTVLIFLVPEFWRK